MMLNALGLVTLLGLLLSACGPQVTPTPTETATPEPSPSPTPVLPTPPPGEASPIIVQRTPEAGAELLRLTSMMGPCACCYWTNVFCAILKPGSVWTI